MPQQPSANDNEIWEFLKRCWSRDPTKRPPTVQVSDAFSQFSSLPQAITGCVGPGIEELPGKLKLQVQSIKISLKELKPQFLVKFKYGSSGNTTSLATKAVGGPDEYTWFTSRPFLPPLPLLSLTQEQSRELPYRGR